MSATGVASLSCRFRAWKSLIRGNLCHEVRSVLFCDGLGTRIHEYSENISGVDGADQTLADFVSHRAVLQPIRVCRRTGASRLWIPPVAQYRRALDGSQTPR